MTDPTTDRLTTAEAVPPRPAGYERIGPHDERPAPDRSTVATVSPWLVVALVIGVAALLYRMYQPTALFDAGAEPRPVAARGELAADESATIELYQAVSPSVVNIASLAVARDLRTRNTVELPQGTGSGFLWDDQGYVVTNYHVIAQAQAAKVTLSDGSTWDARYVGGEPDKDIAVLKIDAPAGKLRPILVGASADLKVGQKVFAIGNPFGLDQTLTTGVISGLGREIESVTKRPISDVIQTDAAINPGNSGGPLLDSAGRLIGVNTAIYSPSGANAGVGFAVPVDIVNRIVPQVIRTGRAERVGLGVSFLSDDRTGQLVRLGELPRDGVLVMELVKGGAAEAAGLRPTTRREDGGVDWGDLIVAVDGREIRGSKDLFEALDGRSAGDEVTITVIRDGETVEVRAKLQVLPTFDP